MSNRTVRQILKFDFGLNALILLLTFIPIHFIVIEYFAYYREVITFIFIIMTIKKYNIKTLNVALTREIFWFILSIVVIIALSLIDSGKYLYQQYDIADITQSVQVINPTIYVLRNAILYAPMVFYFYIRGLSKSEMYLLCYLTSIMSIVSINMYLDMQLGTSLFNVTRLLSIGGQNLHYNTYVPYLTFPFICALYIIKKTSNQVSIAINFFIASSILFFIVISSSRQSVLFVLIIIMSFVFFNKGLGRLNYLAVILILITVLYYLSGLIMDEYLVSSRLYNKYSGFTQFFESSRYIKIIDGLKMLSPTQLFFGAGVGSVIFSGPHNDYIRWVQRIGIVGAILSFLPYMSAFTRTLIFKKNNVANIEIFLTFSVILYTLFHSFFSYPRDDAFQSPYCFLGLIIYFAVFKNKHSLITRKIG